VPVIYARRSSFIYLLNMCHPSRSFLLKETCVEIYHIIFGVISFKYLITINLLIILLLFKYYNGVLLRLRKGFILQ